ncbi:MAG: GMP/IMP nucleotidase [Gammaproteobacteria bacterium]|nr:GMP/IMP nucleotidase [Gammaproteobacteria bacterium]
MQSRIDWQSISTVLLDMDGTLLDLRFDTWFWTELVPERYGERNGLDREEVLERLSPEFESRRGTLEWYCLDFWARHLELDLQGLKHNAADEIRFLPGVTRFLTRLRSMQKRRVLVTNAHSGILNLKLACTGLASYFDAIYSSHEFGVPKEAPEFWARLQEVETFDKASSLFVDDSLPVLESARNFGIRHVMGITKPDSAKPAGQLDGFDTVEGIVELID